MTRPALTERRIAVIRLARTEGVGPITFRRLLDRFGDAETALDAVPELAQRGGKAKRLRSPAIAQIEAEAASLARHGGAYLTVIDAAYPKALLACEDAPPVLTLAGHTDLLSRPCVAIVGARNASLNGRKLAGEIARGLAETGITVVSGLARGIDGAAHEAALAAGLDGSTAAVIAGGLDTIYPPEHAALQRAIVERGCLIAEMPPGTKPQARHFPYRNRIIAGLSRLTVVVEAALRSGSLITARLAGEYGREVTAVPGSPLDPRAQGPNRLIQQGASLVQSAGDVLDILSGLHPVDGAEEPDRDFAAAQPQLPDDGSLIEARAKLLELLSPTPVTVDEVIRHCQLMPAAVQTALLELELAGRVQRLAGGRVCLIA